jgi:hypothetical protein
VLRGWALDKQLAFYLLIQPNIPKLTLQQENTQLGGTKHIHINPGIYFPPTIPDRNLVQMAVVCMFVYPHVSSTHFFFSVAQQPLLDPSRPAAKPSQSPVQWVSGTFPRGQSGWGVPLTTHPILAPGSSIGKAMRVPPSVRAWRVPGQLCVFLRLQYYVLESAN